MKELTVQHINISITELVHLFIRMYGISCAYRPYTLYTVCSPLLHTNHCDTFFCMCAVSGDGNRQQLTMSAPPKTTKLFPEHNIHLAIDKIFESYSLCACMSVHPVSVLCTSVFIVILRMYVIIIMSHNVDWVWNNYDKSYTGKSGIWLSSINIGQPLSIGK